MRELRGQFFKEFWPRLFWHTLILHGVLLFLYLAAPTIEI